MAVFGGSPVTRQISQLTQNLTNEMQKEMGMLYAPPDTVLREAMKKYEEDQKYQAEKEARQKAIDDARISTMANGAGSVADEATMMQLLAQGNPFEAFAPPPDYPAANMPMGPMDGMAMGGPPMGPPMGGMPPTPIPMWGPEGYPLSSVLDVPPREEESWVQGLLGMIGGAYKGMAPAIGDLAGDSTGVISSMDEKTQGLVEQTDNFFKNYDSWNPQQRNDILQELQSYWGQVPDSPMKQGYLRRLQSFTDTRVPTTTPTPTASVLPTDYFSDTPGRDGGTGGMPLGVASIGGSAIAGSAMDAAKKIADMFKGYFSDTESNVENTNKAIIEAYLGESGSAAELAEQLGPEERLSEPWKRRISEQYQQLNLEADQIKKDQATQVIENQQKQDIASIKRTASKGSLNNLFNEMSNYRNLQQYIWAYFKKVTGFMNDKSQEFRNIWESLEPQISQQYALLNLDSGSQFSRLKAGHNYFTYLQAVTDPQNSHGVWNRETFIHALTKAQDALKGQGSVPDFSDLGERYNNRRERWVLDNPKDFARAEIKDGKVKNLDEILPKHGAAAIPDPNLQKTLKGELGISPSEHISFMTGNPTNVIDLMARVETMDQNPLQQKANVGNIKGALSGKWLEHLATLFGGDAVKVDPMGLTTGQTEFGSIDPNASLTATKALVDEWLNRGFNMPTEMGGSVRTQQGFNPN